MSLVVYFIVGFVAAHLLAHVPVGQLCVEERQKDEFVTLLYRVSHHKDRLGDDWVPIGLFDPEELRFPQ